MKKIRLLSNFLSAIVLGYISILAMQTSVQAQEYYSSINGNSNNRSDDIKSIVQSQSSSNNNINNTPKYNQVYGRHQGDGGGPTYYTLESGSRDRYVPVNASMNTSTAIADVSRGQVQVQKVMYTPGNSNTRGSYAKALGLNVPDALGLSSSVALVIDQDANQIIYEKNTQAILPIASITKLMTALVVLDANLPMNEMLAIIKSDTNNGDPSSNFDVGQEASRQDMLLFALMASDNRAASALARYYPGGKSAFVAAMNAKARQLHMNDTHFVDSSGISSENVSSPYDLARLVYVASANPTIRTFSTHPNYQAFRGRGLTQINNTNTLVREQRGDWQIGLQKTGTLSNAGACLVMQAKIMGRSVIMVFLDAGGQGGRFRDAQKIKDWLESKLS